jgi:hypothetical protein
MIITEDLYLKAIFTEDPDGHYSVKIDGVHAIEIHGKDFKDSMFKLVKVVSALKKSNQLPDEFNITSHLKILLE